MLNAMTLNRSLVAASILAFGTFLNPANVYAEGDHEDQQENHESDMRPDGRGNRLRNLPSRRASSSGAVVTGNGISYHNGAVLHTVNLYFLWYGDWSGKDPAGPALLNYWAQHIAPSPYFNINTTYGDTSGNVPNAVSFFSGSYSDTGSLGTQLSDNSIATIVSNGINSGVLGPAGVADPNGLYMVLTAPGVSETSGFLTQYCGWHSAGSWGKTPVQYAFIGNAAGPGLYHCAEQTASSPNNDPGADAMISVMSHELEETATDPQGNAWYDSTGEENADKCAWTFGTTFNAVNGSLANMTLGSKSFLIQQNWLNAQGGKCALSWATTPDFGVSISGSPQTVTAGGAASAPYTLTATPANGFNGSVAWTFSNIPAGITVNAASGLSGSPATFTLSAASTVAAGSYAVTVTGTSGSLIHSIIANLTVNPSTATFTLSITPSSQTVIRPSNGTVAAAYTVKVTAVGAFTNPVTLTVTGGTTGIMPSIASPNPVSPGGSTKLNVNVTGSARRGTTRTLTVTGSAAGTTNKTATATITIQ
jgi:hypothetical protein